MAIRDKNKSARLPSTLAKVSQIKGLSPEEKALFTRIANLVDNAIVSQRGLSNPSQVSGRKESPLVPVPQDVEATAVIGGVDVTWTPVDFNRFSMYELIFDTTPTFITGQVIELVGSRTLIKQQFTGTLYIRVRTVDVVGNCSAFSQTTTITTSASAYDSDQDHIEPENRTTVSPKPTLLSQGLVGSVGELIFVGIGAAIGPGPLTFYDEANSGTPHELYGKIRNQVSYSLLDFYLPLEDRTANIPDYEKEANMFYNYSPFFYIQTQMFTGSMTDFFQTTEIVSEEALPDVEFLRYLDIPHKETGVVLNATMSTIKH